MSVDFVARALAQQAGQAQAFTTLATGIAGITIPASVKLIQTSGYAVEGAGAGTYVCDALATSGLAAAHPRFCKSDAGGRHWRLLPDDSGLIPVACGGAAGFPALSQSASYTGIAAFSAAPWAGNVTLASAGVPGPGGIGDATTVTAAVVNHSLVYLPGSGALQLTARVKAGTSERAYLRCDGAGYCWFNLSTGAITLDSTGTGAIVSLGAGWYEISISGTCTGDVGFGVSNGDTIVADIGDTALLFDFVISDPVTEALIWGTDDQPAIQAAIEYGEAVGASGTRYDAANYALWRKVPVGTPNIYTSRTGLLLATAKSHKFVSVCGQTTLWRRDHDGSAMGIAKFTDLGGGSYWRGGGILTDGQETSPRDIGENSIYLYDIMLDGGITDSSEENNPYGAFMHSSGDGWDVTDKGIWQANDRFCGHIVLEGRSGVRYFMGEMIYGSGVGASIAQRKIRIGPAVELSHTCGSCLNGNGQTLEVENCLMEHGYVGFEGWTGELGGYLKARINFTERNAIQGGIPNFGAGSFYLPTRPTAGVFPAGLIDVVIKSTTQFDVGSWIKGSIIAIDCQPLLGNGGAFPDGCKEVDLDVTTWCDQGGLVGGISILGGGTGTMATDRVSIRLNCKRTQNAVTNGYQFAQAVYNYGSFGPDIAVELGAQEGQNKAPLSPAATVYDNAIKLTGWDYDASRNPAAYYDIETNNNATVDIKQFGNVITTQVTNNGSYNMNLPVTGIPPGYRLFIRDMTKNFVAGGAACRIPAGNFSGGSELIVPPGYGYAELEFDGGHWSVVTAPPKLSATAGWDPASIAAGASETTTVALIGAVAGDQLVAGFSGDLQGMVLTAYVSAANTVTAVLFNPTGAAINLASGTLRVTAA